MAKTIGAVLGAICGGLVALFLLQSLGMVSQNFFGKWREQNRYEIQQQSHAYQQGMQNNLQQMLNDYNAADAAGKQAILSGVRAQYGSFDPKNMPNHLKDFLRTAGIY